MNAPTWHFRQMAPAEIAVDPIQGEFFTTEALESAVDALARECIQNSLDAAANDAPIHVRFFVSGKEGAVPPDRAEVYLRGLREHLKPRQRNAEGSQGPQRA